MDTRAYRPARNIFAVFYPVSSETRTAPDSATGASPREPDRDAHLAHDGARYAPTRGLRPGGQGRADGPAGGLRKPGVMVARSDTTIAARVAAGSLIEIRTKGALPGRRPVLDEIVASGARIHPQQMDHDSWWMGIEAGGKWSCACTARKLVREPAFSSQGARAGAARRAAP